MASGAEGRATPVRVAVVGLGKIARDQHLPAIRDDPAFTLAATASRNADVPGTPGFASLEELLAHGPDVDAVALCTPPQVRSRDAARALLAGKHVLLEKPPGATVAEVLPLAAAAQERSVVLFATWHSRFAPGVEAARTLLQDAAVRSVTVTWKEDVRVWHPGQAWIWDPGGFGVFDPGINALSILTRILPRPPFVTRAELLFPANRAAPIAAELHLSDAAGTPIAVSFDFRQTGPQTWDIEVETGTGQVVLQSGGAVLLRDGQRVATGDEGEYPALYRRFAELVRAGRSDVDLLPLQLVADAFLLGRRQEAEPFED